MPNNDPIKDYYDSEKVLENLQERLQRLIKTWDKREQERFVPQLLDRTLSRRMNLQQKAQLARIKKNYQMAVNAKQERILLRAVSPEDRETFLRENWEKKRLVVEKNKPKSLRQPKKGPFRA